MQIKNTVRSPQNLLYEKNKRDNMLVRMWRKEKLLVRMKTCTATMENCMKVPQDIKNRTTTI